MGAESPLRVVDEFLGGEPAHALHEAALHLADVEAGVQRAAHVVDDVGTVHPHFARQRVDGHFRARRAIGEIEEGAALGPRPVPVDLGRGVIAG